MAVKDEAPLDNTDREIIRVLQRNGRTSNTEIGRALGLTETTIRKREPHKPGQNSRTCRASS